MSETTTAGRDDGVESLLATIRRRIRSEEYYPNQKLSENALAKEFACSRTPVREALKRLEHEGLIEIRPQSGTYVRRLSTKEYTDLLEVRAYLEGLAYRLAVEKLKPDDLAPIRAILDQMDEAIAASPIDMAGYAELHYRFHLAIIELADNDQLKRAFERLNLRASHMFLRTMNAVAAARTQEEHHRIVRQLAERDPRGEKFVIDHLWRKKLSLDY